MATRAIIARPYGDGFRGVYHHWDGYPSGLGRCLYELRNGHFGGDTAAMMRVLIDDHPAGWSSIQECDWSLEPGYTWDRRLSDDHPDNRRPQCYCHGNRCGEEVLYEYPKYRSLSGAEWVYVINEHIHRMYIHPVYWDGEHEDISLRFVEVDLKKPAPDTKLRSVREL